MFCRNCGKQINDEMKFCPFCGTATNSAPTDAHVQTPAPVKKTNGFSIAGFVLSIASVFFGFLFCITPALGLIFSVIGLNSSKETNSGHELALAGVIISSILLAFWVFYWLFIIFIAVSIPF